MSQARPIARRKPAQGAAVARAAGPRLGLALLVIASAQLMVVLDATIVNVALPHIQRALDFSGSGLEWVVNAYALTFGGLLLLGGRAGDLLGRRKMFIAGLLLFSVASLVGGFATSPAFLLAARSVQGAGGALVAPAALSLITTTFPEGAPRTRGFGPRPRAATAGSTCPAPSPAPPGSPPWSTAWSAPPPARAASPTGVMPRSSPRWSRRWCCSPRSRSSRPAAHSPSCRCACCATATAQAPT